MILNWLLCNIWISAIAFDVSKYPESGRASIPKPMLGKNHTLKFYKIVLNVAGKL